MSRSRPRTDLSPLVWTLAYLSAGVLIVMAAAGLVVVAS